MRVVSGGFRRVPRARRGYLDLAVNFFKDFSVNVLDFVGDNVAFLREGAD